MELVCYVGSTLRIKLAIFFLLIRQMLSFVPFLIFKCIVGTKIILESFLKLFVLWKQRTIRFVKWLFESKANETKPLSFKPSGVPTALWISFRHQSSQLPLIAPTLFCFLSYQPPFLGFQPDGPISQLPKCLTLSFPPRHLYMFALPRALLFYFCLVNSSSLRSQARRHLFQE